ncbi:MAG: serine--tRNA ligase, partial [Armatimonadetes bacterium]|nr:serine--tRNA ligase [Armatimonadota bacterium]
MLDRKLVREQPEFVRAQAARKGVSAPVDEFLRIDTEWRAAKKSLDDLRAESKRVADSIGALRAAGKTEEFEAARAKTAEMKAEQKDLEEKERWLEDQLRQVELQFPNLPHASAPDGKDENDNPVVRTWGEKRAEPSKQHQEIAAELKLFDGELGTKISGSRFVVYTGAGAKLLRALVNFMADLQVRQNGYYEVSPPALVL